MRDNTIKSADNPMADHIVRGGMYCANQGNVGSTNQLTAQNMQHAISAHLNIATSENLVVTVSRWNVAIPCHIVTTTVSLPLVDGLSSYSLDGMLIAFQAQRNVMHDAALHRVIPTLTESLPLVDGKRLAF